MRRKLDHSAMAAVGFVEPWSVQSGSTTEVFISSVDPNASFRVISLDRDVEEVVAWSLAPLGSSLKIQQYDLGSWIELPASLTPEGSSSWELSAEFSLTKNAGRKPVIHVGSMTLWAEQDGALVLTDPTGERHVCSVENEKWCRLRWSIQRRVGCVSIYSGGDLLIGALEIDCQQGLCAGGLSIGSASGEISGTLNGRIGQVSILRDDKQFSWSFPTLGLNKVIGATEDQSVTLAVHNLPTPTVASCRFTGEYHDPRLAPLHFDAIHLHDDDFGGFDWTPDLRLSVPDNARSGVFAIAISTSAGEERLPFFVRSKEAKSPLVFLAPTSTYLAYADERLPPKRYPWHGADRGHQFSIDNDFLCLYDVHSDLSGVSLLNARRPKATLRDDYHYPLSNSPHLLPVDLQLLKFYAREGIDIDVITDRDLHDDGYDCVRDYSGLLTGSHPEYWSSNMMGALDSYLAAGGSLAYLGGNGFYWVVAFEGETVELRRVKSDIWTGRPGESHMAITGEPGGNWEDRGLRNPQALLGVTYLIMSFGPSRPYTRLEGSYESAYSWLFANVGNEPIGESGSVLGGAAGYEIDAIVRSEETPRNLVRLAVADGFDDSFQVRPDVWLADGAVERNTLRRADMTMYRHEGGGMVFSASSVAWLGALPDAGSENSVGQIMKNLAKGFSR